MNDHHCDVIGCRAPARWVWSGTQNDGNGNYLCATHWQDLKSRDPRRAVMYSPVGALHPTVVTAIPHKAVVFVLSELVEAVEKN